MSEYMHVCIFIQFKETQREEISKKIKGVEMRQIRVLQCIYLFVLNTHSWIQYRSASLL